MAVVSFSLGPEAVGKVYDCLVCLGKFSESVSIEASKNQLVLTALNPTKSAYASFAFENTKFFIKYHYNPPRRPGQPSKERFSCKIYNKALLAVFKGRAVDLSRENDTDVERCDVEVEDGEEEVHSRFTVRLTCRNGVLKTFRLTFESTPSLHVRFNSDEAKSRWAISARVLREFVDHFGPKTELLDIYSEDGRASFTSYTEKIMAGNEILKQPLHTSIAIDTQEFSEFSVEDKLHIVISVRDFKAIISHAGITNTVVSAAYSYSSRPLQLMYREEGMTSEFILMTVGDFRENSKTPITTSGTRSVASKTQSKQALVATINQHNPTSTSTMAPPPQRSTSVLSRDSMRNRVARPSPPPPQPSMEQNSLFLPEAEDDRQWDPAGENEEDEEMLGWDTSADNDDTSTLGRRFTGQSQRQSINAPIIDQPVEDTEHLPPTQRVSQIRGMFDE